LYDCKQLESERKALAARTADLQKLMDKAETGTGGAVVSELYNSYLPGSAKAGATVSLMPAQPDSAAPASSTTSAPQKRSGEESEAVMPDE
jgi:hypothetical protein